MAVTTLYTVNAGSRPTTHRFSRLRNFLFGLSVLALGGVVFAAQNGRPSFEPTAPSDTSGKSLVALGEQLFRSTLLSRDGTVACQTCHVPALGFSGGRPLAVGVAGYISSRRAPSLLGLKHAKSLMWDGRAPDLHHQAAIPLESPEMAVDWPAALSRLAADPSIAQAQAVAGFVSLDRETCLDALAAYVASLDAGESRFDRYYFGHDAQALSQQEILGLRLFTHKAHCSGCHLVNGLNAPFTDDAFHTTGVGCESGACRDHGRASISGGSADEGAFKTPSLRGVGLRPYLMHDGSILSLRAAVERYNRGIKSEPGMRDGRLGPLYLTADEVAAIVAFLNSLTPDRLVSHERPNSTVAGGLHDPHDH
jgi:cytochrome c peroxidase